MTVADRIKERREELHMSQTDLAKKCGYSDRTSISKIETSGNDITMKKIERVAKALNVTTAYLMGWETPTDYVIRSKEPSEEDIVMELYKNADEESKKRIKRILNYEETILKALRGK